ncbi:hypothetical protein ACHAXN_004765 [Cyclotella atomus]
MARRITKRTNGALAILFVLFVALQVLTLKVWKSTTIPPDVVVSHSSKANDRDVIIYLAQFGHHSSYGKQQDGQQNITGASKLVRSLNYLYKNYVNSFPCDVIVFYGQDNEPDEELFAKLQQGRPRLQFRQLTDKWWTLPHGLLQRDQPRWFQPGYSTGYRHMIRWYAYLVWFYLTDLGYTHVMRMDDDSYIHSPIKYNLFEYMRMNNKRYAFRQPCTDTIGERHLRAVVMPFLDKNPGLVPKDRMDDYQTLPELGFYTNWFMADLSFFLTPPVSTLLQIIDESKIMYTQRVGDLLIQSVVVRLFLPENEIKWFRDFSYEHLTVHTWPGLKGCPNFGALSYGYGSDPVEWDSVSKAFLSRYPSRCEFFGKMSPQNQTCFGNVICQCELLDGPCGYYLKKLLP